MVWDPNDPKFLRRNTDPSTSDKSARELSPDKLRGMRLRAWSLVKKYPDKTATELADLAGDRCTRRVGKRLPELEKMGWVVRSGVRKCTVTGKDCCTWRAAVGTMVTLSKVPTKKSHVRAKDVVVRLFESMRESVADGPVTYTVDQVQYTLRTLERQILLRL